MSGKEGQATQDSAGFACQELAGRRKFFWCEECGQNGRWTMSDHITNHDPRHDIKKKDSTGSNKADLTEKRMLEKASLLMQLPINQRKMQCNGHFQQQCSKQSENCSRSTKISKCWRECTGLSFASPVSATAISQSKPGEQPVIQW